MRGTLGLGLLMLLPSLAGATTIATAARPRADGATHVDPGAPCYVWPAGDLDGDGVFDRLDHCPGSPRGCAVDAYGCPIDRDQDGICDALDQCPNTPPGARVDRHGCSAGQRAMIAPRPAPPAQAAEPVPAAPPQQAPAPGPPQTEVERKLVERARIRLENVFFETSSAQLLAESEEALNEAGAALEKYPDLRIEIEGHTDTRGAADYNQRLSQARAESVRAYLLEHFALRGENLTAVGYGKTRPETRERNAEELRRNRRVELRVLNPEALPRHVKIEGR